jgi:hypothetical protein
MAAILSLCSDSSAFNKAALRRRLNSPISFIFLSFSSEGADIIGPTRLRYATSNLLIEGANDLVGGIKHKSRIRVATRKGARRIIGDDCISAQCSYIAILIQKQLK